MSFGIPLQINLPRTESRPKRSGLRTNPWCRASSINRVQHPQGTETNGAIQTRTFRFLGREPSAAGRGRKGETRERADDVILFAKIKWRRRKADFAPTCILCPILDASSDYTQNHNQSDTTSPCIHTRPSSGHFASKKLAFSSPQSNTPPFNSV